MNFERQLQNAMVIGKELDLYNQDVLALKDRIAELLLENQQLEERNVILKDANKKLADHARGLEAKVRNSNGPDSAYKNWGGK